MTPLDARKTRPLEGGPSFSLGHRVFRAVWSSAWFLLAAWTPPQLHRWRTLVLSCFGAKIHPTARIYSTVKVWYPPNLTVHANVTVGPNANLYSMDKILIGERAVISQGAQLCCGTHDTSSLDFQLIVRPIAIGPLAWVAADAFVGPNVNVGEGAVIGARAVLFRDAEPFGIYVGNPAKLIKRRTIDLETAA
jgi:putative colanic acid biosynthesis acetyltransferase WcaF